MDKVLVEWPIRERFEEIKRIEKDNPGIANMKPPKNAAAPHF